MDRIYLDNAAHYQILVQGFNPPVARTAKVATETTSPDMVVGARIRPLLDGDIAAGFPCAVFPRSAQTGVVDIHDLYNHPRARRPILKVRRRAIYILASQTNRNHV
jgi:kinesin family protein 2/24